MFISPAYAQAATSTADMFGSFIPLIAIFAIFYFLLIRPQQKRQKELKAKVAAVKRGDRVLLSGGMFGTVLKADSDNEAEVEIAHGVVVSVLKPTIMEVYEKTDTKAKSAISTKPSVKTEVKPVAKPTTKPVAKPTTKTLSKLATAPKKSISTTVNKTSA